MSLGGPEYSLPESPEKKLNPGDTWTTSRARVRIAGPTPQVPDHTAHVLLPGAEYTFIDIELQSVGHGFKAEGYSLVQFEMGGYWYLFSGQNKKRHFYQDNVWQAVAVKTGGGYAVYQLMRMSSGDRHNGLQIYRRY